MISKSKGIRNLSRLPQDTLGNCKNVRHFLQGLRQTSTANFLEVSTVSAHGRVCRFIVSDFRLKDRCVLTRPDLKEPR